MSKLRAMTGRSRKWGAALGVVVTVVTLAVFVVPASADLPRDLFELDGNAANNPADTAEDWNKVFEEYPKGDHDCAAFGPDVVDCVFFSDPQDPTDTSIFTTGGSKDDLDIPNWRHTTGSVPDADEILNAYAAMYTVPSGPESGDQVLYFGADRYAVNGSKDFGFWFFRNPVTAQPDGTFSGQHVGDPSLGNDDILILGTFTQGGAATNIRIFRWVGTGGNATANGTVTGPVGSFGDCLPVTSSDDGCATVNDGTIEVLWDYQAKPRGYANHQVPSGGFVEGGINLTDLGLQGCFSSVIAETRSSPSVDAQLKDFALGQFEACGVDINTTPSASQITLGQTVYDRAVVIGSGITNAPVPTGTMAFWVCAPTQLTAGVCSTGGTRVNGASGATTEPLVALGSTANPSDAFANSAPFQPNAVGTWCFRGEYSGEKADPAPPNNYDPAIDFDSSECFTVTDTASTTTAQSWLPQDTATVTAAGGSTIAGTVTFSLYENATCTGTPVQTFANVPVVSGTASTNNTTYYTTAKTISWKATFTSSNAVGSGSPSHCETMTVSVLNNG